MCTHSTVQSCNDSKVRELIAVKVLHTIFLNTAVVAFKVLPLGSYAPIPAPSPPFKTILELVLWIGLQSCRCITPDVINGIKCLPLNISFIFGNRKKSLGVRSCEQAGCSNTAICLVAKNSSLLLFFGEFLWDHFCTLLHVKIFSLDFPNCFSVDVHLLCYASDSQSTIFTHNLTNFCFVSFSSACCWPP